MDLRVGAALLLLTGVLACGENYRIEPMMLDTPATALQIVDDYSDHKDIQSATVRLKAFVQAVDQGQCGQAWGMLASRYQKRFVSASGSSSEAQQLFCQGYVLKGDALVEGNWKETVLGRNPHYLTTPPPEMEIEKPSGAQLFYVIQRDGSFVAVLMVKEAGERRIEPFL